jgi:hypothetical protein
MYAPVRVARRKFYIAGDSLARPALVPDSFVYGRLAFFSAVPFSWRRQNKTYARTEVPGQDHQAVLVVGSSEFNPSFS